MGQTNRHTNRHTNGHRDSMKESADSLKKKKNNNLKKLNTIFLPNGNKNLV